MTRYKVADTVFDIEGTSAVWKTIEKRYAPFEIPFGGCIPDFTVVMKEGRVSEEGLTPLYVEKPKEEGFIWARLYGEEDGDRLISFQSPQDPTPSVWLEIAADRKKVVLTADCSAFVPGDWQMQSTVNSAMMLIFTLLTIGKGVLMTHSAAVVKDGRAWLFIGKSGTGKSTQARMWLKAFPGSYLLNDDHPVLKVDGDTVTAYGSPWSGKTHCYKNLHAPLGGVVRIKQAPYNRMTRQAVLQAYASISTSFSGMVWDTRVAENRHALLEKVVANVPCWVLECLPEEESARVAWNEIEKAGFR